MKRRLFSMAIHLVHVCTASTAHSRKTALDSYLCMCMSHKIVLANNFKHNTTVQQDSKNVQISGSDLYIVICLCSV